MRDEYDTKYYRLVEIHQIFEKLFGEKLKDLMEEWITLKIELNEKWSDIDEY